MRWIILLLIVCLLGAGGFYYSQHHANSEESPLTFCQNDAWLILQCNDLNSTLIAMADSNSIYAAVPSFQAAITNIKSIKHLTNRKRAFIAISGDIMKPSITIISDQPFAEIPSNWINLVNSNSKWFAITNHQNHVPFTSEEILYISDNDQMELNDQLFISLIGINQLAEASFTSNIHDQLKKELPQSGWLRFEFSDEEIMQATAVAKVKGSESVDQNVSNLFRYLPSKTIAAVAFANKSANYAIIYCDYGLEDSTEMFLLIEETRDSANSLDAIANQYFNKSWIKTADINMIGTLHLLSKNKAAAQRFINDYEAFNRLSEAAIYTALASKSSESSFSIFVQKPAKYSNNLILEEIDDSNAITSILFQANSEFSNTKSYSLLVSHHNEPKDELRKYWNLILDKPAEAGPWKFVNHYSNEEEILIQDKLHQLYLINREGKVLWKKQMDNSIVGDIQIIDAFNSGKNQMLFVTKKRLVILDRNGNNIEGFPILLKGEPSTSPTAVQYSKDADIRLLVHADKHLFNYTIEGFETTGWKKPKTGQLSHPIKLLQVGRRDYLIAINSADSILFFDRSGKERQKPIALKINVKQSVLSMDSKMQSSAITTLDYNGNLIKTHFDGTQTSISISADTNMAFAVDPSSEINYTTISGNRMVSYNPDGKEVLGYIFPTKLKHNITWLDRKLDWIAVSSGSEVFVVDTKTGPIERMPIPGDTRCMLIDADGNGVNEILTHQSDGTVTCYQLTY